jgi:non-specific serine/threonine protein kinase
MVSSQDPVVPDRGSGPWPPPASDEAAVACRYRFADVEFDEAEGQLRVAGKPIVVEPRPLRLLTELLRHAGEVVTKEELLDTVWEGRPTVDHVLANAVSKLRTALGEQGAARLATVPRVGYKLAGPVQRLAARSPDVVLQAGQPVPGREGYVLERPLGQGGNSDVWLARHAKLGQAHVFKFAADGPRLSALKREYTLCRVLAQELGPRDDFVRLIDTNFSAAPYFIECAFGGQSLLEWSEAGGRLAGLPIQARLDLFVQIGRAVAAAHSVGVLHKDIKPGNVLVQTATTDRADSPSDAEWQARLTDFGSGRLLDPARLDGLQLTALGMTQTVSASADSRSGTLMYMAPELMTGQSPTVQSDVYAMGVLLWQLLVGDLRRPMTTGWQRELTDELLVDDLRAATEGRPADRLQSAAELVDRVSNLPARRAARDAALAREKVAVEAAGQLQKARARRPLVLATLASLVAGLVVSTAFAWQAHSAKERAETESERANAINSFMREDFLTGIDLGSAEQGGMVSMTSLLDRAAARAAQRFRNQPATEALVRGHLAGVYQMFSLFDRAEAQFRRALQVADPQALARDPELLKLRFGLIGNLSLNKRLKEAEALLPAVEAAAAPLLADNPRLAYEAARARLSVMHMGQHFKEAVATGERLVALADSGISDTYPEAWFNARLKLADIFWRLGELGRGEALLTEALALPQPAHRPEVSDTSRAHAHIALGRIYVSQGREGLAEPMLVTARDELIRRVGRSDRHILVADATLAGIWDARGDFARSRAAYAGVHEDYLRRHGDQHADTNVMAMNLAITDLNLGHAAEALKRLDSGRLWFVKYMGGEKGAVVQAIDFERARAMTSLQRATEAVPILARLDPKALAAAAPARDWAGRLQAERGRALLAAGQRAEGLKLLNTALPEMAANGSAPWVVAGYRALLK